MRNLFGNTGDLEGKYTCRACGKKEEDITQDTTTIRMFDGNFKIAWYCSVECYGKRTHR